MAIGSIALAWFSFSLCVRLEVIKLHGPSSWISILARSKLQVVCHVLRRRHRGKVRNAGTIVPDVALLVHVRE